MALLIASVLIVAAAVAWAGCRVVGAIRAVSLEHAREFGRDRQLTLLGLFSPAVTSADRDPRVLLAWHPLADAARQLFPEQFAAIEQALGGPFPFGSDGVQAAHAKWTADWLAWEGTHDAEYRVKAAIVEQDLAASPGSAIIRARLEAVEREKLEKYQRRYEESAVRVAKALQRLMAR